MDDECAICGGAACDSHHLTGRGPDGGYLDPELTVDECHDDHELLHEDLRQEGIDKPLRDANVFERVAYRLERAAVFFTRLAEQAPFAWLVKLAGSMRQWAGELRSGVAALDARIPAWRLIW
jgi:hypothetical protein